LLRWKRRSSTRRITRHGVGTRLRAGRWGRRAGRPHRDPDSRRYHFAWYDSAALAGRSGGTRGDQADPWDWLGEVSTVPRKERPPGLAHPTGERSSCAGPTRGSRTATIERRPELAVPRSRGSSARIHGPCGGASVEPSTGVAQQPKGYTAAHSPKEPLATGNRTPARTHWARHALEDGTRQGRKTTQRYGTSGSRLQRASGFRRAIGATLRNAKPPQSWKGQRVSPCTHKCLEGYLRQSQKNRAVVRAPQSPIPGPKGDQRASASTSLDRHHARRLPLTRRRAPLGTRDQRRRAPRSSRGPLDRRQ
jgi:hypothetical protein